MEKRDYPREYAAALIAVQLQALVLSEMAMAQISKRCLLFMVSNTAWPQPTCSLARRWQISLGGLEQHVPELGQFNSWSCALIQKHSHAAGRTFQFCGKFRTIVPILCNLHIHFADYPSSGTSLFLQKLRDQSSR